MKIVGVTIVKNEEDVIELFLRHNLNFLDSIHVVDNISGDHTAEIVQRMIDEGLPITLASSSHGAFSQGKYMTRFCASHAAGADYVVPLDADEFIMAESRAAFEADCAKVKSGQAGALEWKTYLVGDIREQNFLKVANKRRTNEHLPYGKIFVPANHFADAGTIVRGNHYAHDRFGARSEMVPLKTALAHFPVRSSLQMASKAILGTYAFRMCPERTFGHAEHWDQIAELVRSWNYEVSADRLNWLAMNYCNEGERPDCDITVEAVPHFSNVEIRYPDLIGTSLLARFDRFIGLAVDKFLDAKQFAQMIGTL